MGNLYLGLRSLICYHQKQLNATKSNQKYASINFIYFATLFKLNFLELLFYTIYFDYIIFFTFDLLFYYSLFHSGSSSSSSSESPSGLRWRCWMRCSKSSSSSDDNSLSPSDGSAAGGPRFGDDPPQEPSECDEPSGEPTGTLPCRGAITTVGGDPQERGECDGDPITCFWTDVPGEPVKKTNDKKRKGKSLFCLSFDWLPIVFFYR